VVEGVELPATTLVNLRGRLDAAAPDVVAPDVVAP
jgi:hypothetical protein